MPKSKNTTSNSRLAGQLQRAKAEIAVLRRQKRACRCGGLSERTREEMIEEICNMVSHLHPEDFDPEKLRARSERLERAAGLAGEDAGRAAPRGCADLS